MEQTQHLNTKQLPYEYTVGAEVDYYDTHVEVRGYNDSGCSIEYVVSDKKTGKIIHHSDVGWGCVGAAMRAGLNFAADYMDPPVFRDELGEAFAKTCEPAIRYLKTDIEQLRGLPESAAKSVLSNANSLILINLSEEDKSNNWTPGENQDN